MIGMGEAECKEILEHSKTNHAMGRVGNVDEVNYYFQSIFLLSFKLYL